MATRDQRRLSAIVSADVAGYSRLMGADESGTLAALKAHRHDLVDPKIAEYGGRIVKTAGDGLLLEFPSVVDAVRSAVDVQRGMAERNAAIPVDQRIEFRIGINLGDIIIDGDDIFGDGVNVAARLQTLAVPGSICVGRAVRDQVIDKLGFAFEEMGPQTLKNIARPIEVFRVRDEPGDGVAVRFRSTSGRRRRFGVGGRSAATYWVVGVLALGLAGIAVWQLPLLQRAPPAAPPPFSVAVMPFSAATGNAGEKQFAAALREYMVNTLSGFRFFHNVMVSDRRILDYKDRKIDTRAIGRDLGARYLVDGDVRANGSAMEVSFQVVDTVSGASLWSGRLTADTSSGSKAFDVTARKLTNLVSNAIHVHEVHRAAAHPIPGSKVDLVLQFEGAPGSTPQQKLAARKFLDEALRIDPDFLPALAYLATSLDDVAQQSFDPAARARYLDEEDKVTLHAVKVDETSAGAWSLRAQALVRLERFDQALTANAKALDITEGRPDVSFLAQRSWILQSMDRLDEALEVAERASAIPPDISTGQEGFAIRMVCSIQLLRGHYKEAVAACDKSAAVDNWWVDHMWLAAAYAQLGDSTRAAAESATLMKLKPDLTIEHLEKSHVGNAANLQRTKDQIFAGLRKAGVPER